MTPPLEYILQFHAFQDAEHGAWLQFVAEWRAAGLPDMNDPSMTAVAKAIEVWGEHLVALRSQQSPKERAAAMLDKVAMYDRFRTVPDATT